MSEQPDPKPNDLRPVWERVIEDMQERDATGRERYGTPLQPFNGRDALEDAYAEELDKIVYLKQALIEDAERRRQFELVANALWRLVYLKQRPGARRRAPATYAWKRARLALEACGFTLEAGPPEDDE